MSKSLSILMGLGLVVAAAPIAHAAQAEDPPVDPSVETSTVGGEDSGRGFRLNRSERCFVKKINRKRARYGYSRLDGDLQLAYVARRHAKELAANQAVYHDGDVGDQVTRWNRLGQNTGKGRSCRQLANAFWNSEGHRANILGQWRFVGVGTAWSGNRLYVQQLFESRRDPGNIWSYP